MAGGGGEGGGWSVVREVEEEREYTCRVGVEGE